MELKESTDSVYNTNVLKSLARAIQVPIFVMGLDE
jgi:hypothetical protein